MNSQYRMEQQQPAKPDGRTQGYRCAFLVPFFGKLPPYFNAWAQSCVVNAGNFHWYLYTDQIASTTELNPAVTMIPYSFREMETDFLEKLNLRLHPKAVPRKICDYDPLFYFFRKDKEPLDRYDFIGYTDLDMIYGKLDNYLPANMEQYSLIAADQNRACGPFTLMKRTAMSVLQGSEYVRHAIEDDPMCARLDEYPQLLRMFEQKGPVHCSYAPLQPVREPGFRFTRSYAIWDKGALTVGDSAGNNLPAGFYHFSRYKDRILFRIDPDAHSGDRWTVSQLGIHPLETRWDKFKLKAWHFQSQLPNSANITPASGISTVQALHSKTKRRIQNYRCAFLVPFFGDLPPYFNVWAKSCAMNAENFHWYLYNDKVSAVTRINPALTIVPYQYSEMVEDFKKVLDLTLSPQMNPRKVCEYRVLFYFLRNGREPLDQYDFIGYTDVDMVYGNLAEFLPEDMKKYAFIAAHDKRGCGPFTLMNRSALHVMPESPYVRNVIENMPNAIAMDEKPEFINLFRASGEILCSAMPLQPARGAGMHYQRSYAIWDHGNLSVGDSKGKLLPGGFFHFSRYKGRMLFSIDSDIPQKDRWSVSQIGIHDMDSRWGRIKLKAWHLI